MAGRAKIDPEHSNKVSYKAVTQAIKRAKKRRAGKPSNSK